MTRTLEDNISAFLPALCCPAVERTAEGQASSPARLLVGSLHDDALLLCRPLALEQFPSPLVLRCRTRTPGKGRGKAIEVRGLRLKSVG